MESTDTITIASVDSSLDLKRIDAELRSLMLAAEGTIPGSRSFGLTRDFLSIPPHEAANLLAIELEEKVETYIPEITIASIEYDPEYVTEGGSKFTIHIERRDGI